MCPHNAATTVPTYIIGPDFSSFPGTYRPTIMLVWPQPAPIKTLTPVQCRQRTHAVIRDHCPCMSGGVVVV